MPVRTVAPVLFALAFFASFAYGAATPGDAVVGSWVTEDREAQFEIYRCGREYCARISALQEPNYPPSAKGELAGRLKMDRKNPDPAARSRPLLGLTIFEGLIYEGGNTWYGRVYNPEDGKTYKCRFSLSVDGNRLKVRGYVGFILLGRTQTWFRQGTEPPQSESSPD